MPSASSRDVSKESNNLYYFRVFLFFTKIQLFQTSQNVFQNIPDITFRNISLLFKIVFLDLPQKRSGAAMSPHPDKKSNP